jgi:hypothetical protein
MMSWRDWSSWRDLYQKWVELHGERHLKYRCKLCGEVVESRPEHLEKKHKDVKFPTLFVTVQENFTPIFQIGYAPESLKAAYEWLMREAGDRDLDVLHIDLLLDPSMTYEDAKKVLKSVLEKPLSVEELHELIQERIRQAKEKIKEMKE